MTAAVILLGLVLCGAGGLYVASRSDIDPTFETIFGPSEASLDIRIAFGAAAGGFFLVLATCLGWVIGVIP